MKPSLLRLFVCALGFFLIIPLFSSLSAQQTGEIRGKITEEKGEALPGVAVTAKSPNLQGLRTAVSDKNGFFRLPLLPVGTYSLTFDLPGFEKLTLEGQDVHLGFTASLSIILKISTISQEITVTAPNPMIDKVNADNSYRLMGDALARIPTQARTIAEVVGFTPGVTGVRVDTQTGKDTGLPSFRGEGNAGNNWLIDGLSIKGAVNNIPAIQVNYDAWDEVQVISDGFAPNMGQALGGFINVVTKSGSNEFHGELGGLLRDWHLRAQRRAQLSAASVPDTSLSDYFGNLGGPIIKDKLWFFLSYDYHRTTDRTTEQSIGWLTIPSGERQIQTNNVFGKITFTPFKNHTLSLSGTLDAFLNQSGGIGVPETYTKDVTNQYCYRLNYRGILSQSTLLTAAWGHYRRMVETSPLSGDFGKPQYYWLDIAQTTNNAFWHMKDTERRTDLAISLIQYLDLDAWGNHEIGAGLSYYSNAWDGSFRAPGSDFDPWKGNGFDNGVRITWIAPGLPESLLEWGPSKSSNATRGVGLYIQDSITLGRFSFMIGLRSETQKIFNDMGEQIWSWGFGDFLQPRASLAFDLLGDGRNILKFGYGRYAVPKAIEWLAYFNKNFFYCNRSYFWIGGENPTDAQLKDPTNWAFSYEQSPAGMPMEVDPQIKPNKANKFLLEFDRQLGRNWTLKIRGIYSYSKNLTEDIAVYDPESPGLMKFVYANFDLKRRNYKAIEIELNGRIANKFMLNASYTWSQAKGTDPGNYKEFPTFDALAYSGYEGAIFGDHAYVPAGDPNKEIIDSIYGGLGGRGVGEEGWYGFLPYSVDHVVKVLGTYFASYGIVVSSGIEFLSGYHWEKKGWSGYGVFFTFPEGRGGRTTPAHMYVDLTIEKEIHLKKGMTVGLGMNVYNLLNSQRPVSYMKEDNELFGQVWGRQLPRWLQFKMTLRF
jgi:hypothetical protein